MLVLTRWKNVYVTALFGLVGICLVLSACNSNSGTESQDPDKDPTDTIKVTDPIPKNYLTLTSVEVNVNAQKWTQHAIGRVNKPVYQNESNVQLMSDSVIYGVAYNSFFKSTNSGVTYDCDSIKTTPQANFSSLYFIDPMNGFIGGTKGLILRTKDGGSTWVGGQFPGSVTINRIWFLNSEIGFAIGDLGKIFKTLDGGDKWFSLLSGSTSKALSDIFFIDEKKGFVVASDFARFTLDGGESWNKLPTVLTYEKSRVYFVDTKLGFVYDTERLWKTVDGGVSWEAIGNSGGVTMLFQDSNTGVMFNNPGWGGQSEISKTTDGGGNWVTSKLPGDFSFLPTAQWSLGKNSLLVAGASGSTAISTDGGVDWTYPNPSTGIRSESVGDGIGYVLCRPNTFISSQFPLLQTKDGGATWSYIEMAGEPAMLSGAGYSGATQDYPFGGLDFYDRNTGYVGSGNKIVKTVDGGDSWTTIIDKSDYQVSDIQILDENTIVVSAFMSGYWRNSDGSVIYNANIIISKDKGSSFKAIGLQQELYRFRDPSSIFFLDENHGFALADSGLYSTTDGGDQWKLVLKPNTYDNRLQFMSFRDVVFTSNLVGFVVGREGLIMKTNDGGETWTKIISGVAKTFYSIDFSSSSVGYIAGDGVLLKSSDSGDTWNIEQYSPDPVLSVSAKGESVFATSLSSIYVLPKK